MNYITDLRQLRSVPGEAARQHAWRAKEVAQVPPLTARQLEVLRLVADGMEDSQIAAALGLAVRTVWHHVANIISAMGVANRTAAAVTAVRRGWI